MKEQELKRKAKNNMKKASFYKVRDVDNKDLEKEVYECTLQQSLSELAVSTTFIVAKTFSLDPDIKEANAKTFYHGVYQYL